MGNWNITIRGIGCHHNKGLPSDANRMAAEFVAKLKAAGHMVHAASFTHGGEDDIGQPGYVDGLARVGYADDLKAADPAAPPVDPKQ